jgi:acyl-CoA thioester hydrolase
VHTLPVRVYYEDTDFSGVAYHASYVRWCERGRSDFLRLLGNDHKQLLGGTGDQEPAALMVRRLTLDYLRPARIDDVLEVRTRVLELSAATLTLDQRVVHLLPHGTDAGARGAAEVELLRANVLVVLVSQSGRVMRLSKVFNDVFDRPSCG